MDNSFFIFEHSGYWVLPILVIGAGISYLVYSKKGVPWSIPMNRLLALIRFIGVSLILFLIMNPLINQIQNSIERPHVVIAVDNSSSMTFASDSISIINRINQLKKVILDEGLAPVIYSLGGVESSSDSLRFDGVITDLSRQLNTIQNDFEGRNLGAILLISDGIYNRGMSPLFRNDVVPIFSIGVGDTVPQKDLSILEVKANRVAYQGNIFPVEVLINARSYAGQVLPVTLWHQGNEIQRKLVTLDPSTTVRFEIEASQAGLKRYSVNIPVQQDEQVRGNNRIDFYVEIVEGKERVLLVAKSPHPDIRSLRKVIGKSENYETFVHIPGIEEYDANLEYDVVIEHGAWAAGFPPVTPKGNPAYWYILSSDSRLAPLQELAGISLTSRGEQKDVVRVAYNENFSKFMLDDSNDAFSDYPTLEVPFGDYGIGGPVEILLFQKIGSITTTRPLMSFYDDGISRSALLVGSGIWKWQLQESALHENSSTFQQVVQKTVQYLSVRNDKKKFIFEPINQTFQTGQQIRFRSESYNEVYERIGGEEIILRITDENNVTSIFNFTSNSENTTFSIGSISEGVYRFQAQTKIGNRTENETGEFIVQQIQLENLQLTANHQLLRTISTNSNGQFALLSDETSIELALDSLDFKSIIHSSQQFLPLINLVIVLVLIILLFSAEWFFRKYLGSY